MSLVQVGVPGLKLPPPPPTRMIDSEGGWDEDAPPCLGLAGSAPGGGGWMGQVRGSRSDDEGDVDLEDALPGHKVRCAAAWAFQCSLVSPVSNCGEYRSAVQVSTCTSPPPPKNGPVAAWRGVDGGCDKDKTSCLDLVGSGGGV